MNRFQLPELCRTSIQRPIIRCVALCVAAALLFPQAPSARRFPVPGHGELVLQVPETWQAVGGQPPGDLPPTFTFSPSSGTAFKVMVTAGGFAKPGMPPMDADALRQQVKVFARNAEPQAVETSLAVKELKGPASHGFYFSATDKAPKPGEFTCLVQGMARVGDIILVFTILTHDGQEAVRHAALEMVRLALIHSDSGLQLNPRVTKSSTDPFPPGLLVPGFQGLEQLPCALYGIHRKNALEQFFIL
jgi:hypothetical protein